MDLASVLVLALMSVAMTMEGEVTVSVYPGLRPDIDDSLLGNGSNGQVRQAMHLPPCTNSAAFLTSDCAIQGLLASCRTMMTGTDKHAVVVYGCYGGVQPTSLQPHRYCSALLFFHAAGGLVKPF